MLETVRQYAQDRLHESGERARRAIAISRSSWRSRSEAHPELSGREARRSVRRGFDQERENLLAAHAWCDHASGGATLGLELAANLRAYWIDRGLFALGQQVFEEALARAGVAERSMERGRTLFAFGQHYNFHGRFADGIAPLEEGLAIAREQGDALYAGHCLDKIASTRGRISAMVPVRSPTWTKSSISAGE